MNADPDSQPCGTHNHLYLEGAGLSAAPGRLPPALPHLLLIEYLLHNHLYLEGAGLSAAPGRLPPALPHPLLIEFVHREDG